MSSSDSADPTLREASDILQQQLVYNGEILDIALEVQARDPIACLSWLQHPWPMHYFECWSLCEAESSEEKKKGQRCVRYRLDNMANPRLISFIAVPEDEGIPDVEVDE